MAEEGEDWKAVAASGASAAAPATPEAAEPGNKNNSWKNTYSIFIQNDFFLQVLLFTPQI